MLADEAFLTEFSRLPQARQREYLFIEDHPSIHHFWIVNSLDPQMKNRLKDVLSRHGHLSPFKYPDFEKKAENEGFEIVFLDDPSPIFSWIEGLNEPPSPGVISDFPGTVQGLLPFQVPAYNFCKDLPGSVLNASTGTGKSLMALAMMMYHRQRENCTNYFFVVKAHNKINMRRMVQQFTGLDSIVIDGSKLERVEQWNSSYWASIAGDPPIIICNYEAFKFDYDEVERQLSGTESFICWDELPSKLRNRQTQLYRHVCKALYMSQAGGIHYPSNRKRGTYWQVMLSATPIEKSPMDFFNAIRLLDHKIYGSVRSFTNLFVASRNQWGEPNRWKNLDLMGAMAAPITFSIDKESPDIAKQFPKIRYEDVTLDLPDLQKAIYYQVLAEYRKLQQQAPSLLDSDELLAVISVLQYVCDNPLAIIASARLWEASNGLEGSEVAWKVVSMLGEKPFADAENVKLDALFEIIEALDSKVLVFAPYNESILPLFSQKANDYAIDHVVYHGELSTNEKQAAQDRFTDDPTCQVFFSSDAGSDSINLQCADTVIHYSLPWAWSKFVQRQNRIHRITSAFDHVKYYNFLCANTVEDRKLDILIQKHNYHEAVLRGDIADQSDALRSTSDLKYILFGQ